MAILVLNWTLTDRELRVLTMLVAAEGRQETVEDYAARVGLKGLRGALEARVAKMAEDAKVTLASAFDAANPVSQDAALAALGYERNADGDIVPVP